jgi:hypothetical protein
LFYFLNRVPCLWTSWLWSWCYCLCFPHGWDGKHALPCPAFIGWEGVLTNFTLAGSNHDPPALHLPNS